MSKPRLIKPTLPNFIRSTSKLSGYIDPAVSVINQDLLRNYEFLNYYGIALQNTFEDDDIRPFEDGLDAKNLVVDKTVESGQFYNTTDSRPHTIYELLSKVFLAIDTSLATSSVATEMASVKAKMGLNLFSSSELSAEGSLDDKVNKVELSLRQMAADIFNINADIGDPLGDDYALNEADEQSRSESLMDLLLKLAEIHGTIDSPTHTSVFELNPIMWTSVITSNGTLEPEEEKLCAPFSNTTEASDATDPIRFYNTYGKDLKLNSLHVAVGTNMIEDNPSTVQIRINGTINPDITLTIPARDIGDVNNQENLSQVATTEVLIPENAFVDFYITAGAMAGLSPGEGIKIHNISALISEAD